MKTALLLILLSNVAYGQCGSDKISQKDLSFADTAFLRANPIRTTVEAENALKTNGKPRKIEITAKVVGYKCELDGDYHVCLKDGSAQMIAEFPNPECPEVKKSSQFQAMKAMRAWFLKNIGTPVTA